MPGGERLAERLPRQVDTMSQQNDHDAVSPEGASQALPAAPRPVTRQVLQRAWAEPSVRFWWVFALLLVLAGIGVAIEQMNAWVDENRAFSSGVVVDAVCYEAGGARLKNRPVNASVPVEVIYEYEGKPLKETGFLAPATQPFIAGVAFPIHIDPKNPKNWTNRTEATSLVGKSFGTIVCLLTALLVFLTAQFQRWRVLRTWRLADPISAQVVGHNTSAIAPASTVIRCAVRQGKQQIALNTFLPNRIPAPALGSTLEVLWLPGSTVALLPVNFR